MATTAVVKSAKSIIRKAGLFYFVWVMFSYCTGGPFGLEDMITKSGPGMTLIYLLIIPLFWSIPVSLVSAEMTTAMPVEGGFYRWARAGFGDFWGFLAGWWNWCASFLLGAVYTYNIAAVADYRQSKNQLGFFLQDSWKVSRKLTLDYGLRYDFGTYYQEEHGRAVDFSAATINPVTNTPGAFIFEGSGAGHCNC